MNAYLINLDRATERRDYMISTLKELWPELRVQRALAVDIKSPDWVAPREYQPGAWKSDRWALGASDIEIFRSHLDSWKKIAVSGKTGIVLEDDLLFSIRFRSSVECLLEQPLSGIVRLDGLSSKLLLETPNFLTPDVYVSRVRSLAPSSAAYLLSSEAAASLVSQAWIARTVDDFLFDPFPTDRGTRGHDLPIWQLEPAPCTQAQFGTFTSPDKKVPAFLKVTERKDLDTRKDSAIAGPPLYRLRKEALRFLRRRREAARIKQIVGAGGRIEPARPAEGLHW